jgi:hypothetical protein
MRPLSLSALAILLFVVPAVSAKQDAILLRRELKPDFEDNYKMTLAIKQTVTMPNGTTMPDVSMTITSDLSFKGGPALKGEKLPVKIVVSNYSVDTSIPIGDDMPKSVVVNCLMDTKGGISEVVTEGTDPKIQQMNRQVMQMMQNNGFPEKAVKPGDTWEVGTAASPLLGNKPIKFHLKFEGERVVDSQPYWVVTAKEKVPVSVDMGKVPEATDQTQGMVINGDMDVTMEMLYEKTGRLFSVLGDVMTDLEVESPQANGKIHVVGDAIQKMNLVK